MIELIALWLIIGFVGAYIHSVIAGCQLRNPIALFFDFLAVSVLVGLFILIWPFVVLVTFIVCAEESTK